MGEIREIYTEGCLALARIFDFSMEHEFGEHATAYLKAELTDEKIMEEVVDNNPLKIYMNTENGREILFCGSIQEIAVHKTGQGYGVAEIRLISNTIQLDKEKECKSFQKTALTYEQLADKVTESKAVLFWNADRTRTIAKPLIQYYETDWEFLKRISSHLNVKLFADIQTTAIAVHIGCNTDRTAHEINSLSCRIGLSEEYFLHKGKSQREFMYYSIISEENLELGRNIKFADKQLTIFKKKAYLDGSRVLFVYDAGGAVFGETPTLFNKDFIGRVIKGEVLSTKNETLRIKMEIDAVQSESDAYDYEWQPESGNVMYCMPQVGTIVSLYFGDWDERTGRIINCIRTNGNDCADMSDSNNKTLTTEFQKRLLMNEQVLTLNSNIANENASVFTIHDTEGIFINSLGGLTVIAEGLLRHEGKNIIIDTPKKISCGQGCGIDGNTESSIILEEDTDIVANDVKYELAVVYLYPNIMDAPEECSSGWEIFGKVLVGVLAAAVIGFIVAALTVMTAGAFAAFSATAATAIAAGGGFGAVFGASFFAGTLAGGVSVAMLGMSENESNSGLEVGDYMVEGAVNSAPAALTAGLAEPANMLIKISSLTKWGKYGRGIIVSVIDADVSFVLTNLLKGDDVNLGNLIENGGLAALFTTITGGIPLKELSGLSNSNPLKNSQLLNKGTQNMVNEAIQREVNAITELPPLYDAAFGANWTVAGRQEYFNYLETNRLFFHGNMSENFFTPFSYINENTMISTSANNYISNVVTDSGEAEDITRDKYTSEGKNTGVSEEERAEKKKEHDECLKERGEARGEYYVTRGAELRCTCGSHMRRLDVNEDGGYRLIEETYLYPYVECSQCVAGEENNIKNFGICSGSIKSDTITLVKDPNVKGGGSKNRITGKGCVPEILGKVWFDTKKDASLEKGEELVIEKSFLACKYGGFIEIYTSGEEYAGELDDGQIMRKE